MPRVSVILPNYNYARYLKERIRTILRQTTADFELLYLDDASQDKSNVVAREFQPDPRFHMHLFEQNSGRVYRRWNDGAQLATGEWLWFAGADDTAHAHFLEALLTLADACPSAVILHARPITIDGEGRIVASRWHGDPAVMAHLENDYCAEGAQESVQLTTGCYFYSASAMLLRADAFHAAGGFDDRLWQAADWDLYLTMLSRADCAYTARPLVCYRAHQLTVTRNTRSVNRLIEEAYCVARAWIRMRGDPRISQAELALVLRRARARVFDLFADPNVELPGSMDFALEEIARVVPDARLLRHTGRQ